MANLSKRPLLKLREKKRRLDMATKNIGGPQTQAKADQPRVTSDTLKRETTGPGLTYRQTGVKNSSGGRTQRSYTRS